MIEHFLLLAFVAGALGFFAPCSIAMLPAYVAYFLGVRSPQAPPARPARQAFSGLGMLVSVAGLGLLLWAFGDLEQVKAGLARLSPLQAAALLIGAAGLVAGFWLDSRPGSVSAGLGFGLVTTTGIIATYLALGLIVVSILQVLSFAQIAIAVLAVAVIMIVAGVAGLFGKGISWTVPINAPRQRSVVGFFGFGVAYGIVSLGCNVALFVVPIAGAVATGGLAAGLLSFLAYAAGTGILMIVLGVSVASSRGLTGPRIRRFMPWVRPLQSAVFIGAGVYIVWYYVRVLAPTL